MTLLQNTQVSPCGPSFVGWVVTHREPLPHSHLRWWVQTHPTFQNLQREQQIYVRKDVLQQYRESEGYAVITKQPEPVPPALRDQAEEDSPIS